MIKIKTGFELEVLAPVGQDRFSIAQLIAKKKNLTFHEFFHLEADYIPDQFSKKPFHCLTKGFQLCHNEEVRFKVVHDMTIMDSINRNLSGEKEWYQILVDDLRLIDLIQAQCSATDSIEDTIKVIATLFLGTIDEEEDYFTIKSSSGKIVCIGNTKMTDRKRVCEVITYPILDHKYEEINDLVSILNSMSFSVPKEAAFHIHFDGKLFANSEILLRLIRYFHVWSDVLKAIIPPNPNCTRLGNYDTAIIDYAFNKKNRSKPYQEIKTELKSCSVTKFCDYNFRNLIYDSKDKFTFEVRAIPMILDSSALFASCEFYTSFLNFILTTNNEYSASKFLPTDENIQGLIGSL